ncbi:MAG: hypothetical protein ABSD21_12745 [Rhizomicrobium sp.]|jgi:hypothetical protein
MRFLISAALLASAFCTPSFAEDVCDLLHRQTQEFSDGGQQGKGDVMANYLDDDVIFVNEGGDKATKAGMSQNSPPLPGTNRTITTTGPSTDRPAALAVGADSDFPPLGGWGFFAAHVKKSTDRCRYSVAFNGERLAYLLALP